MAGMIRQMEFVLFSFHFEERVILAQTFQSNRACGVGLFDLARRKFFLWHQDFSYCSSKAQSDRLDKHNHNQAPRSHSSDQNVHFIINIFSKYIFNEYQNVQSYHQYVIWRNTKTAELVVRKWISRRKVVFSESWASFAIVWVTADMGEGFQTGRNVSVLPKFALRNKASSIVTKQLSTTFCG